MRKFTRPKFQYLIMEQFFSYHICLKLFISSIFRGKLGHVSLT